ncbi:MAG: hypothetical protein KA717_00450 [Woronichinia naegeliana WA131]|jgi:hypothetical protein|uniref:MotA/TolQ/ExbB proton channel domain-containing protein n=1 Tax=Woronichinia naegeliana WA131 TaxID=2824559 RepID=A0A977PXG8_9CYAN|nr:MAG: hypothetical protein KA717_00450 [Woronichinia naegeliana WA131]
MLDFFRLFTPELAFFTLVFIVTPSIVAGFSRISLYLYLRGMINAIGKNPSQGKIDEIKKEFNEASKKLDNVNTVAILEKFYSEEKFTLFGFIKLPCEQWDYFCKSLPNLLIAFGLLGTFVGITFNLKDISSIINQNSTDATLIVSGLKGPLQSMGIAFISSLMAIIFSTTITIINFIFNTEIAKNELFSRLENYLDNPVLSENSEDRVSRLLKKILKDILYTSSKDEERPKSIEDLLSKVLKEAAIPITKSIKDFKDSVTSFQSQVGIFSENTKSIKESFSKLDIGAKSFEKSAIDLEKAVTGIQQHQNNLWEWRNKLADTQTSFATTTKYLGDNIKDLVENNKKATDLAENVYNQLKKSASQFEDSSLYFMEASETIKDSKFADKLLQASDNLADTQTKFAESSLVLSNSTRSIATLISDFQNAITQVVKVGEDIQKLNKVSSEILIVNQENATETKDSFKAIELDLIKLIDSVKEYQYKSILGFQKVGNILISSVSEKLGTNSISLQEVSQTVREYSSNLNAMKQSLEALTANISQVDSQSELKLQTLSALTKEITALHQQSVQMIELNQQQLALENGQLNQIKTELSSLIDQVNNQSSLNLQSLSDLTSEITMVRQQSVQMIELNQQQLMTESEELKQVKIELSDLIENLKIYQQNLNLKPEIVSLGDRLANSITEQLGNNSRVLGEFVVKEGAKNKQDILSLYQNIEQSFLNLREINTKLTNLVELANQSPDNPKNRFKKST